MPESTRTFGKPGVEISGKNRGVKSYDTHKRKTSEIALWPLWTSN